MIRILAWWEMTQAMSSNFTPAFSMERREESAMAVTACLKISLPAMTMQSD